VAWWEAYESCNSESLSPNDKQALERLTGRMPILLQAVGRLTDERKKSLMEKGKQAQVGAIPATGESVHDRELTEAVAASESLVAELSSRMMGIPEVVQMTSAINKFFSAKLSDFNATDDTQGLQRYACVGLTLFYTQNTDPRL